MGILNTDFSAVNGKNPRNSDRIYEATPINPMRSLGLLADFTPVVGGIKGAVEEWGQGNKGMSLLNAATIPIDLASLGTAGGLAKVGLLGIFAGKNAKTADLVKLSLAEKMLADGVDAKKVWKETGWGMAPDGMMKFEIDDSRAVFDKSHPVSYMSEMSPIGKAKSVEEAERMGKEYNAMLRQVRMFNSADGKLGNAFLHRDLYDAFPGTDQLRLEFKNTGSPFGASYGNGRIDMSMGNLGNEQRAKQGVIHELQHHVQELTPEAAKGGSPEEMLGLLADNPSYGKDPKAAYLNLYGEAESRLADARSRLSSVQRLDSYPWEPMYFYSATGTPLEELIFKYK